MAEKGVSIGRERVLTGENNMTNRKKTKNLPRIAFAAPGSGSGKTVVTCGFLKLLQRKNLSCISFKCGPDYIDPMFHRYVLGIPGYNLDSFFLSPEQVKDLLFEKAAVLSDNKNSTKKNSTRKNNRTKTKKADFAVIEGVMGFYDGIGGDTVHASTYEIAKITDTPVVLVIDGKKSSLSLAALAKGFLEYTPDSHIRGVILNRTSPAMAERLKPCLEKLGIHVYGAVPVCEEANWESRHLGLTLPGEQEKLQEKIEHWADRLEEYLDVEGLLELANQAPMLEKSVLSETERSRETLPAEKSKETLPNERKKEIISAKSVLPKTPTADNRIKTIRRIAIARDEAFCFYYQDNLDLLQQAGWELIPFSPLCDHRLPCAGISAILLGGGYPEVFVKELSENHEMIKEIQTASRHGIKFLAECGGFLYLHEWLEGTNADSYPMAGLLPAKGFKTNKLSRFGYITLFNAQGNRMFRGHEFHYWDSTLPGKDWKAVKPLSTRQWDCMVVTENMLAGFPHLYYGSNPEWILRFLSGDSSDLFLLEDNSE